MHRHLLHIISFEAGGDPYRIWKTFWSRIIPCGGGPYAHDVNNRPGARLISLRLPTDIIPTATMSTTLLVHPTSLSLTTLPRVGPSTPLPFPTRFPKGAEPRTAMSPVGHTYLWADSMPVVWEYDSRGRRVGEIKLTSSRERVKAVGCGEGVIIASTAGTGVCGGWRASGRGRLSSR